MSSAAVVNPEILDNLSEIKRLDPAGMLATVVALPDQLLQAYESAAEIKLPKLKKFSQIIVCGMGGSAISGNIISNLLGNRVLVNRHYDLPDFVDAKTLVLALSYSGNTEETLSAVKQALKCQAQIVCVTSGGELKKIAAANELPVIPVPAGFQPRAALAFLLISALVALAKLGVVKNLEKEVKESAALLKTLGSSYLPETILKNNPVKQVAKKIFGKIPVILATSGTTEAAGLRLKTQLNENSKLTALFNVFPELNHNEIVNLAALKKGEHNFALILLRDSADSERIKKRIEITKSLIGGQLGGITEIESQGASPLSRTLSLIYFGDLLSVYLAFLQEIDPTPVAVIERLKKELCR
ncbi:MAG: bifunctional phosphoglucose/phosphomannose isomerase [bacterium]